MFKPRIDMTGVRYGSLVCLSLYGPNHKGQLLWNFACDCGRRHLALGYVVRGGSSTSCGCVRREAVKRGLNLRHGQHNSKLHRVWAQMKQRCENPHHKNYKHYGARGITVCDEWKNDFRAFLADMSPRPHGLTLERINNDGPYAPWNCRWATMKEQCQNRRKAA
jgi:hypothetical protein